MYLITFLDVHCCTVLWLVIIVKECYTTRPDSAIASDLQWGIPLSPDRADRTLATLLQCKHRMLPQGSRLRPHLQGDPVVAATPQRDLGLRGELKSVIFMNGRTTTRRAKAGSNQFHLFVGMYVICSFVQFSTCSTVL